MSTAVMSWSSPGSLAACVDKVELLDWFIAACCEQDLLPGLGFSHYPEQFLSWYLGWYHVLVHWILVEWIFKVQLRWFVVLLAGVGQSVSCPVVSAASSALSLFLWLQLCLLIQQHRVRLCPSQFHSQVKKQLWIRCLNEVEYARVGITINPKAALVL